jgi:23S rRNA pseudouridine2604 synthase
MVQVRINKYLAEQGLCTRREADEWIKRGWVKINKRTAELGDKVGDGDVVELVKTRPEKREAERVYLAYNKPEGVSTNPEPGSPDILQVIKTETKVFPVGRLDKMSSGLIILTNDGRITDRLLNPKFDHDKEYEVEVDKPINTWFLKHMASGVDIEGYVTAPAEIDPLDERTFSLTIAEGKKHQIRRMCVALGYQVQSLKRVRIMNIELGDLTVGESRPIVDKELKSFLAKLGLK